ncbi:MAG: hypothetical protein II195_00515 [Selenomonadales bacterium]|nr:hypothetical protein [Selenomonadales bacterium]
MGTMEELARYAKNENDDGKKERKNTKQSRILEIFFRGLRGEDISVQNLAYEYEVTTKSISRSINDLKSFLAEHRDLVGNTDLQYSYQDRCYRLYMDEFLTNKELFALVEVMIGARAFSKMELLTLTEKLKRFTTTEDRPKLNELIRKEIYHYPEVKHDCESVQETLWQLINCITEKQALIDTYESCLRRIRASAHLPKAQAKKKGINRVLFMRDEENAYDADELYSLFVNLPADRVSDIRRAIREEI